MPTNGTRPAPQRGEEPVRHELHHVLGHVAPHATLALGALAGHREEHVVGDLVRRRLDPRGTQVVDAQRGRDVELDREGDDVRADHDGQRWRDGRAR